LQLKANHCCVDKIIVPSKQRTDPICLTSGPTPMNVMKNSINIVMGTINHDYIVYTTTNV
jgi:hypothetical protein